MKSTVSSLCPAAALLLLALAPVSTARGGNSFTGLFGTGGARPGRGVLPSPEPREAVFGIDGVTADDFPVFQGFRVHRPGQRSVLLAHPGMVRRSQQHLTARLQAKEGLLKGTGLQLSRPLGEYVSETDRKVLMEAVVQDATAAPVVQGLGYSLAQRWFAEDTRDALRRRLEAVGASLQPGRPGASERSLAVELMSFGKTRRRHLLVYRAELRRMAVDPLQGETGAEDLWWFCEFYDPHAPEASPIRLSHFRVKAAPGADLDLEFSSSWLAAAATATATGDDFALAYDEGYRFSPVPASRLTLAEDTAVAWGLDAYGQGYREDGFDEAEAAQRYVEGYEVRRGLGKNVRVDPRDWVGGEVEFGAFDRVD